MRQITYSWILWIALISVAGEATAQGSNNGESDMAGLQRAAKECVYLAAEVLQGGFMQAEDHAVCETYPCTIRFHTNCPLTEVGATGFLQGSATDTPEKWVTDPWVVTGGEVGEKGTILIDWRIESDPDEESVLRHTGVRIFRSGSNVWSFQALMLTFL